MRTKFDIGAKVWYLDIVKDTIVSAEVKGILVDKESECYKICVGDTDVIVPSEVLYSSREGCRAHYIELMK